MSVPEVFRMKRTTLTRSFRLKKSTERSVTPPARVTSAPNKDEDSSEIQPNVLDDTAVSSIQNSSTSSGPNVKPKSRMDQLEEKKRAKDEEKELLLLAQMESALATAELFDMQRTSRKQKNEVKSEVSKEQDKLNFYSYCLETVPAYIQAQHKVDEAKKKKEELSELLFHSKEPITDEQMDRIAEDLQNLQSCMDKLNNALVTKGISVTVDALMEALKEIGELYQRIENYKMIDPTELNLALEKMTKCAVVMEKLVGHLDKMEELLEEKNWLVVHLASLKASVMLRNV